MKKCTFVVLTTLGISMSAISTLAKAEAETIQTSSGKQRNLVYGDHGAAEWIFDVYTGELQIGRAGMTNYLSGETPLKDSPGFASYVSGVKKISFKGPTKLTAKSSSLFSGFQNLEEFDATNLDTSDVVNASYMFANLRKLKTLDLENLNTSSISNMESMFQMNTSLETLKISNWNVKKVTNMKGMFAFTLKLKNIDLNSWKPENLTNTNDMFQNTSSLDRLDLSNWDTSKLKDTTTMFQHSNVSELLLSNWDTRSLESTIAMFFEAKNLKTLDIGSWDTRRIVSGRTARMFEGTSLEKITLNPNTKLTGTSLENPLKNELYTGSWKSLNSNLVYKDSDTLLNTSGTRNNTETFVWEKMKKEVTFHYMDGLKQPLVQNTDILEKINEPAAPTRMHYDFTGWYTSEKGNTKWAFDTELMPNSTLNLYAQWRLKNYDVHFTNLAGEFIYTANTEAFGSVKDRIPTKEYMEENHPELGLTFTGWDKEKVLGEIQEETIVTPIYETSKYTVTFVDMKGKEIKKEILEHGKNATPPKAPDYEGFTFNKWDLSLENITQNTTIKATYTENQYMVTFVDYDGKPLSMPQEVTHGKAATPPTVPARVGYTFDKWDIAFNSVKGNLSVKAMYKINQYTVTFKNSDGKVLKTEMVNHGSKATAPANPMRKDYTFTGWDKAFDKVTGHASVTAKHNPIAVNFKTSVTSKTIGKKKAHTLSVNALNVGKNRVEYTIANGSESYATVNKTTGKVTTKDKTGTFKVNVKVIATNGTSKTMTVTYKTIHQVTDILTDQGKKLATKVSVKKGKTATLKTKAISGNQKASEPKMSFASSNKKVATIDQKGKIKGIKKGTATMTITVKTADGSIVNKKITVKVD